MTPATKTRKFAVLYALLLVFLGGFFVFFAAPAYAADPVPREAPALWNVEAHLKGAFSAMLYSVFLIAGLTVSLGAVMIEYALNPIVFSGLFNLSAVYNLWMMVRDFFNLFFILVLLFIAFATIFQVQAYNYKKLLWHLLLMALLVNFSFPVSRFIIDTANVPMYFFLNSIAPAGSKNPEKQISKSLFTLAQLQKILLPGVREGGGGYDDLNGTDQHKLIQATIFVFIFGISLTVLGILLLIRSLTLLVLVIFSPIGFIGTAIPGFGSHAKKWWETLMSNAFFGPTAALMLLVSVQVMAEFNASSAQAQLNSIAQNIGGINLASLAQFFIPIILIWMSITVGKSFGIAGAGTVIGQAQKFIKVVGRKVGGIDSMQKTLGSFQKVQKSRKDARLAAKGGDFGTRLGKRYTQGLDMVQSANPLSEKSRNFAMDRIDEKQKARVKEEAEWHRVNDRTSDHELLRQRDVARKKPDKSHLVAVHQEMAKRDSMAGEIISDDMKSLEKYYVDRGDVENAVMKETREKVAEKNASAAYDNDIEKMTKDFRSGKIKMESQSAASLTSAVLQAGLESGKVDQKVLDELSKDGEKSSQITQNFSTALQQFEDRFEERLVKAISNGAKKDLDAQRVSAHQAYFSHTGEFHGRVADNAALQRNVLKKADATTLKVISRKNEQELAKIMPKLLENAGASKTVNMLAKLAEDGARVQASVAEIISTADATGPGLTETKAAAEEAHQLMGKDHRFAWVSSPSKSNAGKRGKRP